MQEEVCAEVPVRNLFLVLMNLRIQRLSRGWKMERRLVGTICTHHLETRLLREQLNRYLRETRGIVMVYKL